MRRFEQSLNGLWRYTVNGTDKGLIRVPYSSLCVGDSTCALTFNAEKSGSRSFLCFEGITYRAVVTFNGKTLGVMLPYSFYSFEVTDLIKAEGNDLRVDIKDMNVAYGPSEGWENYGGIIRDVYLLYTDTIKIDDIIWRTSIREDHAAACGEVTVTLDGGDETVTASLYDSNGCLVVE